MSLTSARTVSEVTRQQKGTGRFRVGPGGAYIAHSAMCATVKSRSHGTRRHVCATQRVFSEGNLLFMSAAACSGETRFEPQT